MKTLLHIMVAILGAYSEYTLARTRGVNSRSDAQQLAVALVDRGRAVSFWHDGDKWIVRA